MIAPVGIPTEYEGIHFRSRLEARWAAFFDLIGWRWTYEPIDCAGWIPDFVINGDRPALVEIKPAASRAQLSATQNKIEKGIKTTWEGNVLLLGLSPLVLDTYSLPIGRGPGLFGSWFQDFSDPDDETLANNLWWNPAAWVNCDPCGALRLRNDAAREPLIPCGHRDGEIIQQGDPVGPRFPIDVLGNYGWTEGSIDTVWRHVGNETQWRGNEHLWDWRRG